MPWILLFCAGLLEIGWAYCLKRSEGFSLLAPSLVTLALMVASFLLLSLALRSLPLGAAYAVWTGIGTLGAFIVGIVFLGEAASLQRLLAVALILAGIAMMKLSTAQ